MIKNVLEHDELPGISIYLVRMTPEAAAEVLTRNTKGQRTISPNTVEKYASDMGTMDWIFNGAAILISNKNELLDGQHRLTAIVESGISQILLVVHGVDAAAMLTIDANRTRSYADILKIREFANHSYLAALTSRVWQWFHGNYGVSNLARVPQPTHLGSAPSNAQRDFWWKKIEEAYEITFPAAVTFGMTAARKMSDRSSTGISPATYSLAWVILSGIDKDNRELFFHELLNGGPDKNTGNPIVALHNRLHRRKDREKYDNIEQLNDLFTVYNYWALSKPLSTISALRLYRWNTVTTPHGYRELDDDGDDLVSDDAIAEVQA